MPVDTQNDSPRHFCGVVGIYSPTKINIPEKLFFPLFSLQHRGQESAGISYRKESGTTVTYKDLGMVSSVLSHYLEEEHLSHIGIGHVRYSTRGGSKLENVQPIQVCCNKGEISLAHNGNLSNAGALHQRLSAEGSIFQTTSDSETILHMIARSRKLDFFDALSETLKQLEGAFSMVMIHNESLIAFRDPNGFRPLYMGQKDGMTIFASETCALDILAVRDYRSVQPGEMIIVNKDGLRSESFAHPSRISQCAFELIYFARPDSEVFDRNVHTMRKRMGAALAREDSIEGDIVIPVPDSGNSAALGYAEESGIPFEFGLTRNHYAGRSFIMPTKAQRELLVRMKLHPVKEVIRGKRIIMVDDSLVRGTTSKILVNLLRSVGAKEIHLRLSSPEITNPCYYGIDIPTTEELISNRLDNEGIARYIGADSVRFLPRKALAECLNDQNDFCYACFSGKYPVLPDFGTPIKEIQNETE